MTEDHVDDIWILDPMMDDGGMGEVVYCHPWEGVETHVAVLGGWIEDLTGFGEHPICAYDLVNKCH